MPWVVGTNVGICSIRPVRTAVSKAILDGKEGLDIYQRLSTEKMDHLDSIVID